MPTKTNCLLPIVLAGLVFWGSPLAAVDTKPDAGDIAVVNGAAITRSEFTANLNHMKQRLEQQGRPMDEAAVKKLEKDALDALISQELLYEESRKDGIKVEKSEVDDQLARFKKQFPTEDDFQKALSERSLTVPMLEAQIDKGIAIRRFIETRIVGKIQISDKEAKEFYDANPSLFQQPETIKASHILIKVEPDADASKKAEADQKFAAVEKQIQDGADFTEVASQSSEGPSRTNGGDLGFFGRGQMVPAFEEAAFALEPGQVSGKVVTPFGYHIIKVTDKKPGGQVSFDEAKEKIVQHLKQEKSAQGIQGLVEELKSKADIQIFD